MFFSFVRAVVTVVISNSCSIYDKHNMIDASHKKLPSSLLFEEAVTSHRRCLFFTIHRNFIFILYFGQVNSLSHTYTSKVYTRVKTNMCILLVHNYLTSISNDDDDVNDEVDVAKDSL